jgi:hypothetical protein
MKRANASSVNLLANSVYRPLSAHHACKDSYNSQLTPVWACVLLVSIQTLLLLNAHHVRLNMPHSAYNATHLLVLVAYLPTFFITTPANFHALLNTSNPLNNARNVYLHVSSVFHFTHAYPVSPHIYLTMAHALSNVLLAKSTTTTLPQICRYAFYVSCHALPAKTHHPQTVQCANTGPTCIKIITLVWTSVQALPLLTLYTTNWWHHLVQLVCYHAKHAHHNRFV